MQAAAGHEVLLESNIPPGSYRVVIDLAAVRRTAGFMQVEMAAMLGVGQAQISKLEHQDDMLISTLSAYRHALGATAQIVVQLGPSRWLMTESPVEGSMSRRSRSRSATTFGQCASAGHCSSMPLWSAPSLFVPVSEFSMHLNRIPLDHYSARRGDQIARFVDTDAARTSKLPSLRFVTVLASPPRIRRSSTISGTLIGE
jgi:hypothetical protein